MTVFHSLLEAIRAGYQVEHPIGNGYVVRQRINGVWCRAIVEVK